MSHAGSAISIFEYSSARMKPFTISKEFDYYFCTDTIVGWQYVFTSFPMFNIIADSLKYCRKEKGLRIHGYVIMPNHIHTILSARDGNLSDILRDFKRFTSRRISEQLEESHNMKLLRYFSTAAARAGKGNDHKVWRSGSHPIALYSDDLFDQKLNYIHQNPVRKGYVDVPEHWLFSSARNYAHNDHSIVEIDLIQ